MRAGDDFLKKTFKLRGGQNLEVGGKTLVMGILNFTPDSFSDGGRYFSVDKATAHAAQMIEYGADILDVGAESTRPGATPVDAEEELARLKKVLPEVRKSSKKSKSSALRKCAENCRNAASFSADTTKALTTASESTSSPAK